MSFQLSPQMKIVALVGLLAVFALGGGTMLLGRKQPTAAGSSGEPTAAEIARLRRTHVAAKPVLAAKPVAKKPVAKTAAKGKPALVKAKPVARTKPMPKAKPKPKPEPAVAANGLPSPLADALRLHDVVVVSLYNPNAADDSIAFQEARAGAGLVDAGFVPLSVLSQRYVGPLTEKLGHILPAPGVLVYRAPDLLVTQIDGFADKETVAQAVENALAQ